MFSLLLSLFVYQMQLLYLSTSLYVCQQLFYLFFCCFLFINFLCESLFIISYPVWLVKNFFNFFFIPDWLSCRHQPQQLLSLPSAICFVNTFFHFSPKNFNSRESSVFFKNTPRILAASVRVHVMHLHDLFLLRTSASALRSGRRKTIIHRTMCAPPEAVSDGGSAPTTDTDLLPTTYRGGSHFPIWCIWYRLQVQCQLYCPLRLHNGGRFTSNQAKHFRCTNMSFHIFFITPSQNGHEKQLWCFHTKGTQYKYFYLNTDIAKRLSS